MRLACLIDFIWQQEILPTPFIQFPFHPAEIFTSYTSSLMWYQKGLWFFVVFLWQFAEDASKQKSKQETIMKACMCG